MVYYIGASDGPVKVGITTSIKRRLAELQTGSPQQLHLLGWVRGDAQVEQQLHAALKPHQIRGEWFEREHALAALAAISAQIEPSACGVTDQISQKTTRFVAWLFEQTELDHPIADLAHDVRRDANFPRQGNVAEIRAYLSRYGDHVEDAFEDARRVYRAR